MPTPALKREAAAVTSCDGLDFVLTTLSPTPGKGEDHGFVYQHAPSFKPY